MKWIPCSERLPSRDECLKNDCRFIVTDGNRTYQGLFDAFYSEFVSDSLHGLWKADKCVIAWMPLPEPYKDKVEVCMVTGNECTKCSPGLCGSRKEEEDD